MLVLEAVLKTLSPTALSGVDLGSLTLLRQLSAAQRQQQQARTQEGAATAAGAATPGADRGPCPAGPSTLGQPPHSSGGPGVGGGPAGVATAAAGAPQGSALHRLGSQSEPDVASAIAHLVALVQKSSPSPTQRRQQQQQDAGQGAGTAAGGAAGAGPGPGGAVPTAGAVGNAGETLVELALRLQRKRRPVDGPSDVDADAGPPDAAGDRPDRSPQDRAAPAMNPPLGGPRGAQPHPPPRSVSPPPVLPGRATAADGRARSRTGSPEHRPPPPPASAATPGQDATAGAAAGGAAAAGGGAAVGGGGGTEPKAVLSAMERYRLKQQQRKAAVGSVSATAVTPGPAAATPAAASAAVAPAAAAAAGPSAAGGAAAPAGLASRLLLASK